MLSDINYASHDYGTFAALSKRSHLGESLTPDARAATPGICNNEERTLQALQTNMWRHAMYSDNDVKEDRHCDIQAKSVHLSSAGPAIFIKQRRLGQALQLMPRFGHFNLRETISCVQAEWVHLIISEIIVRQDSLLTLLFS